MSIEKNEFQKSLARLQNMAKGTQLHHTPSDSNPGTWPGGAQEDLDENGGDINIDDNGTDYQSVRKSLADKIRKSQALTPAEVAIADGSNPLPAIGEKVSKGLPLTPAESWAASGGFDVRTGTYVSKSASMPGKAKKPGEAKDANSVPDTHGGEKMPEDEVEGDAKKSFDTAVNSSLELQKGLELSPFLYELTRAIGSAMSGAETRVVKSLQNTLGALAARVESLEKSLAGHVEASGEFNKSLAETVVHIGDAVSAGTVAGLAQAQQPARGPKSQMMKSQGNVQVLEKSNPVDQLTKSQIGDAMVDLVKSNELSHLEVLKYESTGQVSPATLNKVVSHIRQNGAN